MKILILGIFMCAFVSVFGIQNQEPDLKSLIDAELEFAKYTRLNGIKNGFLSYLTDEAIILRPQITKGKQYYQEQPESDALLIWEPEFADVSKTGDIGYTYGPWEYSKDSISEPHIFGHYVSIWEKQDNGKWKVIIDTGIPHQKIKEKNKLSYPKLNTTNNNNEINIHTKKESILDADKLFSSISVEKGYTNACSDFFSEDVVLFRSNHLPIAGKILALEFSHSTTDTIFWKSTDGGISKFGDIGYTYGIIESKQADDINHFSYLRIWKYFKDSYKVVFDLMLPIPKENSS